MPCEGHQSSPNLALKAAYLPSIESTEPHVDDLPSVTHVQTFHLGTLPTAVCFHLHLPQSRQRPRIPFYSSILLPFQFPLAPVECPVPGVGGDGEVTSSCFPSYSPWRAAGLGLLDLTPFVETNILAPKTCLFSLENHDQVSRKNKVMGTEKQ